MNVFLLDAQPHGNLFHSLLQQWTGDSESLLRSLPKIFSILLVAFILMRIVAFITRRMSNVSQSRLVAPERVAQLRTASTVMRATAYGVIGFFVVLHLLPIFNINLTPLLASAGVAAAAIGFGAQTLVHDMLNGVLILFEDQFNIGDVVKLAGLQGQVEMMTLRTTTLRDGDGTLYIIPNSQITTVSNYSRDYSVAVLNVSVSSDANPDHVVSVLKKQMEQFAADSTWHDVIQGSPDVPGIDRITGQEAIYPVILKVGINQKDPVLRELRRRILLALRDANIPFANTATTVVVSQNDPSKAIAAAVPASAPAAQQPAVQPAQPAGVPMDQSVQPDETTAKNESPAQNETTPPKPSGAK
jgi:small-conductance mechanosensitive channel